MRRLVITGLVACVLTLAGHGLAGAGAYPPSAPTVEVDPTAISCGANVTVRGAGWQAGSTVTITLTSEPVVVGTPTVAGNGTFEGSFGTPSPLDVGVHRITVEGSASDGSPARALAELRVTVCGNGGALAFTGSDSLSLAEIAIILSVIGAVLLVTVARRKRAHPLDA